uniref:CCZ1/INTU/HSP4 first Longin domain-containing protein n=1 Tax=Arion vulgaris TaxID=1028688 RepID=A0A0B7A1T9_9EUPU
MAVHSTSSISLLDFFVFNAEYGSREGEEHKKILYYYPAEADIDTQIKKVGLSEAIVKFAETFSDKPCQTLHTQKSRYVFFEPEPSFWMIMLFNGTFTTILMRASGQVDSLKQRLDYFYHKYLLTLKIPEGDILDVFNGIQFLPLDKNSFLRIQSFINSLEATFPFVKYTAFLWNEKLVWSGLEQDDMCSMYKYLTSSLFPASVEQELHGAQIRSPPGLKHGGRFITGPPDLNDDENMGKIPRVFVNTDEVDEECYLVVYVAMGAAICMLVKVNNSLNLPMCRKLDSVLGPQMTRLASDINEQHNKRTAVLNLSEPLFKYVYFNHMNLAQQTTIHFELHKKTGINIPQDILRLLGDMNADFSRDNNDGETIVKANSDYWVVGKKSDQREFYVVINQRSANLMEINEEVKRLCGTYLNNVFFLD